MNHTTNYQLNQWEATDKVQRVDFNADNAKIDAAIKAVDVKVDALDGRKADASALTALSQTVAGHTSALAGKGNCRIWTTSYTGNGQNGQSHPNSLSFPSQPLVVFIAGEPGSELMLMPHQTGFSNFYCSWSGSSVSWYSYSDSVNQRNQSGQTYRVVALLAVG